jgi:hypothetical protein
VGKYYSRHGGNLYIYVTQDDAMISLDFFPKELNLFDSDVAWRIKDNMAVVNDADESDIDKAEIILSLNAFKRWDHSEETLELYYARGDESILGETLEKPPEVVVEPEERVPEPEAMEVIIPRAISPLPESPMGSPAREDEVIIPPTIDRILETPTPRREEPPSPEMTAIINQMTDEIKDFANTAYFSLSDDVGQRLTDWFNHIEAHWKEIEPILKTIAASPYHTQLKRKVKKRIDEIESLDPETIDSIMKELNILEDQEEKGTSQQEMIGSLPLRVSVEVEYPDYDAVENRVLKSHLDALVSRLSELLVVAKTKDDYLRDGLKHSEDKATVASAKEFLANHEIMEAIEGLKRGIEDRLEEPTMAFLGQLQQYSRPVTPTETFSTHPDYSLFYAHLKSYEESAPPLPIRLEFDFQNISEGSGIYAKWCTVKILQALMELGYKLKGESLKGLARAETEEEGVDIILTGEGSEIRLTREKLYSREPPYGSYSTSKRVTLALEVFRGDAVPRVIVFEPKYDFDYSDDIFKIEDLERLHVLRDSIVDLRDDGHDRIVMGGFLLHTGPTDTVRFDDLAGISLRLGTTVNRLVELLGEFLSRV